MPIAEYLAGLRQAGYSPLEVPSLFWLSSSDLMLHGVCALAALCTVAVIANRWPRAALVTLWGCWLSLLTVCSPFLSFQWDTLLLESTFFFFFIFFAAPGPPTAAARFALAVLACKVTLESGLVKILGGDTSWRDLTALTYHWWTQPLPTWTSFWLNGAFAHMTKTRPEIIVEGSADGTTWLPYEFDWKPGRVDVRPKWIAPLQPRLDWQMWFAALSTCGQHPFLLSLQRHLLLGTPEVLALLAPAPFDTPPKFIRTVTYEYRFAPLSAKTAWWVRTETGPHCPPLQLGAEGELRRAEVP